MHEVLKLAKRKAEQSGCRYKVSAVGLNKKGEVIATATNQHRFMWKGGTIHAEIALMKKAGPGLRTILIARVGTGGKLLPIHPCAFCAQKAQELGLKIVTVDEISKGVNHE